MGEGIASGIWRRGGSVVRRQDWPMIELARPFAGEEILDGIAGAKKR